MLSIAQHPANISATLFGVAFIVFIAWYPDYSQHDAAPGIDKGIPEVSQRRSSQALTTETAALSDRIDRLETKTSRLRDQIRHLDPVNAPSIQSLGTVEAIERRALLDPGPSPLERARHDNRTPSGMSARALRAHTQETGIDSKRIEALMQRAQ